MTAPPDREPAIAADPRTICPYLLVATGHWRNAEPSRDHVCTTEAEVIPVGLETQRRLCFGEHTGCRRYQDAVAAYEAAVPLVPLRPIARTTPVVVDRGRAPLPIPRVTDRRTLGQALLALVMIAAVTALLVARLGGPAPGPGASGGPGASVPGVGLASPTPTATPRSTPSSTPRPTPTATPRSTPSSTPTAKPSTPTGRTYTVQPGDTLSSIAARFGTTVKVLQKLNGITNASLIHPGQVLKLP
jgi:LysM repeat protein